MGFVKTMNPKCPNTKTPLSEISVTAEGPSLWLLYLRQPGMSITNAYNDACDEISKEAQGHFYFNSTNLTMPNTKICTQKKYQSVPLP